MIQRRFSARFGERNWRSKRSKGKGMVLPSLSLHSVRSHTCNTQTMYHRIVQLKPIYFINQCHTNISDEIKRKEEDRKQTDKNPTILTLHESLVENQVGLLKDTNSVFIHCKIIHKYEVVVFGCFFPVACISLSMYILISFKDYFKQFEMVDSPSSGFLLLVVLNPLLNHGLLTCSSSTASSFTDWSQHWPTAHCCLMSSRLTIVGFKPSV